jgi:hypothetical protein
MNKQIQLPNPIILRPQLTSNTFSIIEVLDNPSEKYVKAVVKLGDHDRGFFDIWQGEEYDRIGQWTDTDLENALIPLITSHYNRA